MHKAGALALLLLALPLGGCATYWQAREADRLLAAGDTGQGVALLARLAEEDPDHYRLRYLKARDKSVQDALLKAQQARQQGRRDDALAAYQAVLALDPRNADARYGLELIARDERAARLLEEANAALEAGNRRLAVQRLDEILTDNPAHPEATGLRNRLELESNRALLAEPELKDSLTRPVSLEFRNASVQAVFEVLSQASGINFIFDKDVKTDLKTTIFARDTSVESALGLILRTNQLSQKVLNDSTLLIYPSTPDKEKQYEDLVMRTFYLGNADPKKVQEMVRALVAPKSLYVDDRLKVLVVRDTLSVIETVERLVAAYDLASPEVMLDVEILEVSTDALLNLGIQYPDKVSAAVFGAAGKSGQLTVKEYLDLNRGNVRLFFPDPLAVLNLKQTSSNTRTLANPRIRVSNREKAKVLVGDKVPVITTTTNQTSSASSESVSYLDVGLKLEVEPEVHVGNDVSINVGLEVSNIVKEIKSTTGLLTYQIGTRNASTTLRLRDGETQVLAGLIKNEERDSATHLPGLGKLPLLGKLFSNETKGKTRSEVVLLITPHVLRTLPIPSAHILEFASGTGNRASTQPLRLMPAARYSSNDKRLLEGAGGTPVAVAAVATAEVTAAARLRLDLVTPAQVPRDREFTVALMLSGDAVDELEFDLALDQPGLEFVKAVPVQATGSFEVSPSGNGVHVKAGALEAASGPLAMLTFRATRTPPVPATLLLQNARARKGEASPVVALPAPRPLLVTP